MTITQNISINTHHITFQLPDGFCTWQVFLCLFLVGNDVDVSSSGTSSFPKALDWPETFRAICRHLTGAAVTELLLRPRRPFGRSRAGCCGISSTSSTTLSGFCDFLVASGGVITSETFMRPMPAHRISTDDSLDLGTSWVVGGHRRFGVAAM